ncbi:MAG: hypothetical protein AMXMBFR64_40660 [Myxococcales bacterium]
MKRILTVLGAAVALAAMTHGAALACGIEGKVVWPDGSKSNKTTTVSTSWNSQRAYPSDGWYSMDLGSAACGAKITVYLDGNQGREVRLPSSGNARVDFTAK